MFECGREEWPLAIHAAQGIHAVAATARLPSSDRRTETVPAGQHDAALGPTEYPRDGAQILDARGACPGRGAAADVEVCDLADHRGVAEIAFESRRFVDQRAVGSVGVGRQLDRTAVLAISRPRSSLNSALPDCNGTGRCATLRAPR
jgi:hypothetical protein